MRQPKPFFRRQTQCWYVQIGKRQINLGPNESDAWTKYHEIMAADVELTFSQSTVAELLDIYLDWCQKRRSEGTYKNHRHYCASLLDCIGKQLPVRQLKPKHITEWLDKHPKWSNCAKHDAISTIQRAFNWAVKQGHIDRSPIPHIEDKPRRTRREIVYSAEQFKDILGATSDSVFRRLLEFMWETGCRPLEASSMQGEHCDLENRIVILPEALNKTKKGNRVIFLTERAVQLLAEQLKENGSPGHVFRNRRGNRWNKDSINCRFQRMKKKLGVKRLCAYGIRHSFATEGLKNNVDPISLSILMGHADVTMISRTYQHLTKNPEFLLKQAMKAKGA